MIPVIYIDMDDVLADLAGCVHDKFDIDPSHVDRGELFKKYLPEYAAGLGFEYQRPTNNSQMLVDHLTRLSEDGKANLAVLTSHGDFYHPTSEIVRQKKAWLIRHFPNLAKVPFCATSSGADKSILAHPFALLIDDWGDNIRKFIAAGGHGIVYHDDNIEEILNQIDSVIGTLVGHNN